MKHRFSLAFCALAAALLARAGAPVVAPPSDKACCEPLAGEDRPATSRSLYQLNATWIDDAAHPVRWASLRGRPVVLAMIFTHCEYACPMIVADMQRLRAQLPPAARAKTQFVLVSFDSARDTPAALADYRTRMTLDSGWTLLRGESGAVQDLAMLLGVKFKQDARGQFAHSNLITVLNSEGEIVHQITGLQGDATAAVKAVTAGAR